VFLVCLFVVVFCLFFWWNFQSRVPLLLLDSFRQPEGNTDLRVKDGSASSTVFAQLMEKESAARRLSRAAPFSDGRLLSDAERLAAGFVRPLLLTLVGLDGEAQCYVLCFLVAG
jgi:hypothetical protein